MRHPTPFQHQISGSNLSNTEMSDMWVNQNGVFKRQVDPRRVASGGTTVIGSLRRKVLVHLPTEERVVSYAFLDQILTHHGWEIYLEGNPNLLQYHKPPSIDLISLPKEFSRFNSIHMYDIVIKTPNIFHVRDF